MELICVFMHLKRLSIGTDHEIAFFMCFLDASKAFDRINHGKLFAKLLERGVPSYIIRILQFWYSQKLCKLGGG